MKTNQSQLKIAMRVLSLMLLLIIVACSSDEVIEPVGGSDDEVPMGNEETIDDVVANLSYDPDQLLGVVGTGSTITEKVPVDTEDAPPEFENNVTTNCTTTTYSLETNFEDIAILKPNAGIIWPGALVKIDNDLRDGLPTPVTLGRAPVDLRVDLPGIGEDGNVAVDNPTFNSVDAGIDTALEWWNANAYDEGYVNEGSSFSSEKTAYSSKQVSLELGINIQWASTDFSSQLNFQSTKERRVANMVFKQVFYTVSMVPPASPTAVFNEDLSSQDVASTFSSSSPPGYIQSVSYGRIIMFRLETNYESTDVQLEAALGYAAGKNNSLELETEATLKSILANSSITTVVIGGNAEVATEAVTARDFGDLAPIIQGSNAVYSRDNPGSPISYTVRFLKDNTLAKMGYTESYTAENCSSEGVEHRTVDFINDTGRSFRVGLTYKNNLQGSGGSISKAQLATDPDRGWVQVDVSGSINELQPPNGAYDIRLYVQDEDEKDVYQYDIGDTTSSLNSCHRATTGFLGCCLEIQKVTCN
ncbi:thiol-activated cytolysin family protein [Croceitalea vernalis]|uniref:Thiol-activated cytolysin family protein n=1 Tax=Croceitalea vernalis TaxID=3075599 RepID=A0ABU3BHK1_9FLAO|nr:thiol-activated cytolysin family protein [Croceitalea sp. P007]MDT0621611.1 thiol-activated cytolysin family protein [Croceitalea sp. P007]